MSEVKSEYLSDLEGLPLETPNATGVPEAPDRPEGLHKPEGPEAGEPDDPRRPVAADTPDGPHAPRRWTAPAIVDGTSGGRIATARPLTAQHLAEIEEAAREAGFRAGLEEGRAAGRDEVANQARRLAALLDSIVPQAGLVDDTLLAQLSELVMSIVRQLIRRELHRDPGEVVGVVRDALAALPVSSSTVHLYTHPDDALLVRDALRPETMERPLQIHEALDVSRGGARVETETSTIDATVEARISAIAAAVFGDERVATGSDHG